MFVGICCLCWSTDVRKRPTPSCSPLWRRSRHHVLVHVTLHITLHVTVHGEVPVLVGMKLRRWLVVRRRAVRAAELCTSLQSSCYSSWPCGQSAVNQFDWLINSLSDWLAGWLIDSLIHWVTDSLSDNYPQRSSKVVLLSAECVCLSVFLQIWLDCHHWPHSLVDCLIDWFFTRSSILPFDRLSIQSFFNSFIHSFIYSSIHSIINSLICSVNHTVWPTLLQRKQSPTLHEVTFESSIEGLSFYSAT